VLKILRIAYPDESITIQSSGTGQFVNSQYSGLPSDLNNGLWEDTAYIDEFIATSNHDDTPTDRVVRIISAQCESKLGHSVLAVATMDFRRIFDDVDAWFIQSCASMITQVWQRRLLSEAIRAKERFLRGISHQLRTPIHGILGAAELLNEDLKAITISENAKIQPALAELAGYLSDIKKSSLYLDTISTAGRELMSTVNSMITLNRWADVAVAERHYASHDISELELELMKGVSDAATRHTGSTPSIFFHCDLPLDCRCLETDLSLLRDSVLPLIINAIQYTSEGAVIVTSSKQQGTDAFVIDVEDTGCGILPDDQSRIFELYEKGGEHSTGAGLGLPLATKFSTLLHGSIELISSRVDRGSHFRATFRDVRYLASAVPSHIIASSLRYLPPRFYQLGADLPDLYLSSNFTKFLIRNGLTSSGSYQDCFAILESARDSKQNHSYISTVPSEQVVICLVPTSVDSESLEALPNVIYASGPFSTLNLMNILQEADNLAMMINPAKRLVRSNTNLAEDLTQDGTAVHPNSSDEPYSTSDEGYSSMDGSPSTNGESGQTLEHGGESDLDRSVLFKRQSDEPATRRHSTIPPALPRSSKPLTLVVDDNTINLRILQMYCKKRGLSCLSAADGKQAVEIFSKRQAPHAAGDGAPIELILMDLQMPVCNGIDATQEIRSLEKQNGWNSSILFMVTGQDSEMDRAAASTVGADDYLVKPIGMRFLDSGLKRYFPAFKN
jgi:signal transduction histidine kinase/CheY-like chemotaxis protein